jgi:hypothetical protein
MIMDLNVHKPPPIPLLSSWIFGLIGKILWTLLEQHGRIKSWATLCIASQPSFVGNPMYCFTTKLRGQPYVLLHNQASYSKNCPQISPQKQHKPYLTQGGRSSV